MKKLFLALLLVPTITYCSEKSLDEAFKETREKLNDPEYLKYILGGYPDLHFHGVVTPHIAQGIVQKIHTNLISQLHDKKDHFETGKSLAKKPDAVIVNTCATIEQRLRENGEAGMISANHRLRWIPFQSTASEIDGERFFERACPCNFYNKLTDEQLEQLIKGTQEAGK